MGTHRTYRQAGKLECVAFGYEVEGVVWIVITFRNWMIVTRPGDLLVCYRLSNFQRVSNISGDPCTHVAMLDVIDGKVMTIEMGADGVFVRSFAEFAAAYEWIGVIHLDSSESERSTIVADARRRLQDGRMRYSLLQCGHIAAFGLARRALPAAVEPVLSAIALASSRVVHRREGPDVATCSGFIAQCLDAAFAQRGEPAWPIRPRVAPWRRAPDVTAVAARDDLRRRPQQRGAVNVLMSPSDLFVTVPSCGRTIIGPDDVTLLPGVHSGASS